LHGITRAQDQYRFVKTVTSPLRKQIQSVTIVETQIEHDRIVRRLGQSVAGRRAGVRDERSVGLLVERLRNELRHLPFVFDDENLHAANAIWGPTRRRASAGWLRGVSAVLMQLELRAESLETDLQRDI
jgi:hypothetical protein